MLIVYLLIRFECMNFYSGGGGGGWLRANLVIAFGLAEQKTNARIPSESFDLSSRGSWVNLGLVKG